MKNNKPWINLNVDCGGEEIDLESRHKKYGVYKRI